MPRLSLVLPTLNCMPLLPSHVKTMRPWLDQADEIVVVDSHSNDGTPEYLAKQLKHDNVKIHSRPRGLYQSWNFGIEQTAGDWIYVSTVGDAIAAPLLKHLLEVGETMGCDVVCSRPNFIDEQDRPVAAVTWPIDRILRASGSRRPLKLAGAEIYLYALLAVPAGLLGSSASNVYRGPHLRARPFPTEFGTVGDTAWALRYGLETAFGFTPERGSWFRFHAKAYTKKDYEVENLIGKLVGHALEIVQQPGHGEAIAKAIAKYRLIDTARMLMEKARSQIERSKQNGSATPLTA